MIINAAPLSMAESLKYVGKDSETEIKKFMKKFVKIKTEKAEELRKKFEEMDMIKVKSEHIVKIIDLMPDDKESLNKIFTDVSLDEDEAKKILGAVEEFR